MTPSPHLEDLLAHAAWARALARTLVADPNTADDLVQDALLAATHGAPPRGEVSRGWLAEIVRNVARRRHRSEHARQRREEQSSRVEATTSAAELVERAQLEHTLAAAVLALEEPGREVVLLRFFEGLSSAEIARRQGVPESTVRNRLARALAELRERLDREHGGRDAWMGAFVAAFGLPEFSAVPTTATTSTIGAGKLALAGAVLLLVVAWSLERWPFDAASGVHAPRGIGATGAGTALAGGSALESERASPRSPAGAPSANGGAATHALLAPNATLRGRLLLPDGSPANDVELALSGWARNTDVMDAWPDPIAWETQRTTSAADGRFELHFAPPPPYDFTLSFHAPGFARRTLEWDSIAPASEIDVGDVRLELGATLRVKIRDAAGQELVEGWAASAMFSGGRSDGATAWGEGGHDATPDGWFEMRDLLAGSWDVSAQHGCGLETTSTEVHVDAGAVEDVVLAYSGPDPARTIVLSVQAPHFGLPRLDPARVRARGSSGSVHAPDSSNSGSPTRFLFTDLAPDTYAIEIDDPGVQPWTSAPTTPGSRVHATLMGACTIALNVVDVRTQSPVTECILRLDPEHSTPRAVRTLRDTGPIAPLVGLVPGRYSLSVETRDLPRVDVPQFELVPGETRTLTIEVGAGRTIAGRVVEADGTTSVPRAIVRLFHRAERDDSAASPWCFEERKVFSSEVPRWRHVYRTSTADDDGRFEFAAVPFEDLVVRADADGGMFGSREDLAFDMSVEDVEIRLAPRCVLDGRLLAPENAVVEGLTIEAWPVDQQRTPFMRNLLLSPERSISLSPDATFRFETLTPGSYRLWLTSADLRFPGRNLEHRAPGEARELGVVEVHEGTPTPVEYDLRQSFPATIVTQLSIDGEVIPGLLVVALAAGDTSGAPRAVGMVNSDGTARLTPLPPGTYTLYVRSPNAPWNHRVPNDVTLVSGRGAERTIDVASVEGTITCVDDTTGEPLVREDVAIGWRIGDFSTSSKYSPTDEHGRISMRMLPGRYTFQRAATNGRWNEVGVELEWTEQGPTSEIVRLR